MLKIFWEKISQEKKLDSENNGEVINTDENEKNKNQDQEDSKLI